MAGPPDSQRDKEDLTEEPEPGARRLIARVVVQVRTFAHLSYPLTNRYFIIGRGKSDFGFIGFGRKYVGSINDI